MLNIANSIKTARMDDITIYFGQLMCHGKYENIGLSYSPKTKKLKLYHHKDNTKDIDFVKLVSKEKCEKYIMTRLFLLFKSTSDVIAKAKLINCYNQKIPDSYILVLDCDYGDKLDIFSLLSWLNKDTRDSDEFIPNENDLIDLIDVVDDNENISYPTSFVDSINTGNEMSDYSFLRKYFDTSRFSVDLNRDIERGCRYSTSFNGYTLNLNTLVAYPTLTIITLNEDATGSLKGINPNHSIIACYLTVLNSDNLTEFDKILFQLLIDNSSELTDSFNAVFSYTLITESLYNLLRNNNINFSTLIDIIYHAQNALITSLNEVVDDSIFEGVKSLNALNVHMFLVYMFHYLIKKVNSLKAKDKSLFKIIK